MQRDFDIESVRAILTRAVARTCPPWLAAEREDIVQAAVVRILELQSASDGAVRTASYLWKTAYSITIDEIRRRRRHREVPLDDAPDAERPAAATPETDRSARELARHLRSCLHGLIEARRLAVTLHLQGHGLKDGAGLLGWDAKRFENLVYRGLADLRLCLRSKGAAP